MARRKTLQVGVDAATSLEDLPADDKTQELSEPHQKFARHYARYSSIVRAYHFAYPNAGYGTCDTNGRKLLGNARISEFIKILQAEDRKVIDFDRHRAIQLLSEIAENPFHKQQREAINDLWEKLGLNQGTSNGNWFDGFGRIAELVSKAKGTK